MANPGMSILVIATVTALLLFAGFLAASEAAINSISRVFVEELETKSSKRAAWVQRVLSEPARYLNVVLFLRKANCNCSCCRKSRRSI